VTKKERFDFTRPDTREIRDRIVHGAFVTEGTMVAFPTCFPGVTIPVPGDESRITAMDAAHDGIIYAGTSGRRAHLLVGMFHGITGMVFDMGAVDGADHAAAIGCGTDRLLAAVNGPEGGRLVGRALERLPFDLIQEWHIAPGPLDDFGAPVPGERIVHAVTDADRQRLIGVTERHLFSADIATGHSRVIADLPGRGRLARDSAGRVLGLDENAALWCYDPDSDALQRQAIALPPGAWDAPTIPWARDPVTGRLYIADADGTLFAFAPGGGFEGPLGRAPLAPVGPMVVTLDGRLFGFAGEGMSRLFCFDGGSGEVRDLGVAVSVFERRRYGYAFGDAVVGRDGEIVFGENDDLGHLWLYFPRIRSERS
jgi:hypothetical protein